MEAIFSKLYENYEGMIDCSMTWTVTSKKGSRLLERTLEEISTRDPNFTQTYESLSMILDEMRIVVESMRRYVNECQTFIEHSSLTKSSSINVKSLTDRGDSGLCCSAVDLLCFMQTQVSLYEDELDSRESILEGGAMDLNAREFTILQLTWDTSPFLNRKKMQNITQRMDLHYYLSNRGRMT